MWYNKILKKCRNDKSKLLKQAVRKYIRNNIDNKELKIYNLIQDLSRIDKNWISD